MLSIHRYWSVFGSILYLLFHHNKRKNKWPDLLKYCFHNLFTFKMQRSYCSKDHEFRLINIVWQEWSLPLPVSLLIFKSILYLAVFLIGRRQQWNKNRWWLPFIFTRIWKRLTFPIRKTEYPCLDTASTMLPDGQTDCKHPVYMREQMIPLENYLFAPNPSSLRMAQDPLPDRPCAFVSWNWMYDFGMINLILLPS